MSKPILYRGLIALFLTPMACGALAQTPAPQVPQRTTASYQDWTLRCESREGQPPVRNCEIVQSTTTQGQPNPVTQIAVGRVGKGAPLRIVFQVPVNVLVGAELKFVYDAKAAPLAVSFRHCVPTGCFADAELKDDLVKKLRPITAQGHFEFKDAAQRGINIPVSFKGFAQALDAMAKG